MAVTPGILADGQLPAATGDLYTAGGNVYITTIIVSNAGAATRTVNLYVRDSVSAADRLITPLDLQMSVGDCLLYTSLKISLNNGDKIRGDADAAANVDYTIWGGT
jgi:hypothetical protein